MQSAEGGASASTIGEGAGAGSAEGGASASTIDKDESLPPVLEEL